MRPDVAQEEGPTGYYGAVGAAGVDVRAVLLAWAAGVLAVVVVVYTGLSLVAPLLRIAVPSSVTRVVIEVVGVCALLFAAAFAGLGDRHSADR